MTNDLLGPPPPFSSRHSNFLVSSTVADEVRHVALSRYRSLSPDLHTDVSSRRGEYTVALDHRGRTRWTLTIISRSANSKSLPSFVEEDLINGTVDVDLPKPDRIKAVAIVIRGHSAFESKTLLEVQWGIWPAPSASQTGHIPYTISHGDLPPDHYRWPFSLSLPSEIQLSEKESNDYGLSFRGRLSPSLEAKGGHGNIHYEITVQIKRKDLFNHDYKLATLFDYVPATKPPPPSRLRALAYEGNLPVIGPDTDTEGWKIYPNVQLDCTLFKVVDTSLSTTLALPIPLSYPRGTAFPCALKLSSSNKELIHLLSALNALVVEVHKQLQMAIGESMVGGVMVLAFTEADRLPLTKANWHPSEVHEENGVYAFTALGELNLPPDLIPSFTLGKFICEYVVEVYPPVVAGFEPASNERIFHTPFTVTSHLRPGPRPRAYLPPGYTPTPQPRSRKSM